MTPIDFPEVIVVFAKDQPEYLPLPAHMLPGDPYGRVTCCWKLTWRERLSVLLNGVIWQQVMTFRKPLQPQKLLIDRPEMVSPPKDMTEGVKAAA